MLQRADIGAAAALLSSTLDTARALQLISIDVRCQVGLGLVAIARGDVRAAEAAFKSAIAASEEQRSALPGDDRQRVLVDQLRPYEELLRISLKSSEGNTIVNAAARVLVQLNASVRECRRTLEATLNCRMLRSLPCAQMMPAPPRRLQREDSNQSYAQLR